MLLTTLRPHNRRSRLFPTILTLEQLDLLPRRAHVQRFSDQQVPWTSMQSFLLTRLSRNSLTSAVWVSFISSWASVILASSTLFFSPSSRTLFNIAVMVTPALSVSLSVASGTLVIGSFWTSSVANVNTSHTFAGFPCFLTRQDSCSCWGRRLSVLINLIHTNSALRVPLVINFQQSVCDIIAHRCVKDVTRRSSRTSLSRTLSCTTSDRMLKLSCPFQ